MRYLGFLGLFLICSSATFAQLHKWTVGAGIGSSFYLGDMNPNRIYDEPHLMGSLMGAYEWNEQFSTRMQMSFGGISGTAGIVDHTPGATSFSDVFGMLDVRNEFNFFPYNALYDSNYRKNNFSPYFHFGIGLGFLPVGFAQVPFGVGFKYKLNEWINLAWEWTFHKTFTDRLDGYTPTPEQSRMINNDWVSYTMLSVRVPLSRNCNCIRQ